MASATVAVSAAYATAVAEASRRWLSAAIRYRTLGTNHGAETVGRHFSTPSGKQPQQLGITNYRMLHPAPRSGSVCFFGEWEDMQTNIRRHSVSRRRVYVSRMLWP